MKRILLTCAAISLWMAGVNAQNLGINADGSKPDKNAILDVKSSTKGVLFPRMTSEQRKAIPPTMGMLVYDVTTQSFWYNDGTNWNTMGLTVGSTGFWDLTGNAGTNNTNFLGTTDNAPLRIRVNNLASGGIDHNNQNTFWGYGSGAVTSGLYNTGIGHESLTSNTTGYSNTALGRYTLRANTEGQSNTAMGMDALTANITGSRNTAIGMLALLSNVSGHENTAIGFDALRSNTSGGGNTALGTAALFRNSGGYGNTATGSNALYNNSTGSNNTASGNSAMLTNSGFSNTAIGAHSMWLQGSGSYNVAVGDYAMYINQTGDYNTAIGSHALTGNHNGSFNTAIGTDADVQYDNLTNATAIGAYTWVDASNKVRIGNSAVTVIEGQVPFTTPSDGRFKFNVEEDVKGLDFIMQLRPVTYQFDVKRFDGKAENDNALSASYNEAQNMRRTGFIAQEVEAAAIKTGFNFSGIIKPKKESDHYSLSYDAFVVPLVKAMQEQQQVIEDQNKKIADLEKQIEEIKKLLQDKK